MIVRATVLAVVAIAGVLAGCAHGDEAEALALVPAAKAGADPFTDTVQVGPAVSLPGNVEAASASVREDLKPDPASGGLAAKGTTPGLYGGSGDAQVCDPEKLVAFLDDDPAKARAWADVIGIEPSGIGSFVDGLTPLVLASDTLVVNHGFHDGKATAVRSVLQAGTAVMVDDTGVPRVKCNCGNPLGPAPEGDLADAEIEGAPWELYSPAHVVSVTPADTGGTLTVIDLVTGELVTVPVGSTKPEPTSSTTAPSAASTTAAPATTAAPTTTAAPPTTVPGATAAALNAVDWANLAYDVDGCIAQNPIQLAGGSAASSDGYGGANLGVVAVGDATDGPGVEAAVVIQCNGGGSASASFVAVFALVNGTPTQVGNAFAGEQPSAGGGHVVVKLPEFGPNDPLCCPSSSSDHTWTWNGSAWTES